MEALHQKKRKEMEGESDFRAWDDLIPDYLGLIFKNLVLKEVLLVIPTVCKPWYKVVEGPYCWQRIDIDQWSLDNAGNPEKVARMLRMLLTRSSASLRELNVSCINDDHMLLIAEHLAAGSLETLTLKSSYITDAIFEKSQVASKLTSLTTLDLSYCEEIRARALSAIGTNCKALSSLTWNVRRTNFDNVFLQRRAEEGRTIARTMPKLKHLSIAYFNINTEVALEILSGCPDLEYLNIKGCWCVHLGTDLLDERYPKVKAVPVDENSDGDYDGWDPPFMCDPYLTDESLDYESLAIEYYSL